MTNGERLCIDFLVAAANLDMDWWNAEYKEPNSDIRLNRVENELNQDKNELESTPKNNFAADCISRQFMYELGATCIATRNEKTGNLIALGAIEDLPPVTPISKDCTECIAEDKTFMKMDRIKQLLNSDKLDDLEVLEKIREVVEE